MPVCYLAARRATNGPYRTLLDGLSRRAKHSKKKTCGQHRPQIDLKDRLKWIAYVYKLYIVYSQPNNNHNNKDFYCALTIKRSFKATIIKKSLIAREHAIGINQRIDVVTLSYVFT